MNILIDGIIIAIFVCCCIWGYKSGLVKMTVNLLKNIIAIVIASVFASRVGAFLYDTVLKSFLETKAVDKIAGWLGVDPGSTIDVRPLLDSKHSEFTKFLERLGFKLEQVGDKYSEIGGEAENAGEVLVEYLMKPLGTALSNVIAFILIFIASVLVIKLIGFIVNKIVSLPVLNITNKLLGLVLGAALGVVFVFIFVAIVDTVIPLISINGEHFTAASIEEGTIAYKYLVGKTPVTLLEDVLHKTGIKQ